MWENQPINIQISVNLNSSGFISFRKQFEDESKDLF